MRTPSDELTRTKYILYCVRVYLERGGSTDFVMMEENFKFEKINSLMCSFVAVRDCVF